MEFNNIYFKTHDKYTVAKNVKHIKVGKLGRGAKHGLFYILLVFTRFERSFVSVSSRRLSRDSLNKGVVRLHFLLKYYPVARESGVAYPLMSTKMKGTFRPPPGAEGAASTTIVSIFIPHMIRANECEGAGRPFHRTAKYQTLKVSFEM